MSKNIKLNILEKFFAFGGQCGLTPIKKNGRVVLVENFKIWATVFLALLIIATIGSRIDIIPMNISLGAFLLFWVTIVIFFLAARFYQVDKLE